MSDLVLQKMKGSADPAASLKRRESKQ